MNRSMKSKSKSKPKDLSYDGTNESEKDDDSFSKSADDLDDDEVEELETPKPKKIGSTVDKGYRNMGTRRGIDFESGKLAHKHSLEGCRKIPRTETFDLFK